MVVSDEEYTVKKDIIQIGTEFFWCYRDKKGLWFMEYAQMTRMLGGQEFFARQRLEARLLTDGVAREFKNSVTRIKIMNRHERRATAYPQYVVADLVVWQTVLFNETAAKFFPHVGQWYRKDYIPKNMFDRYVPIIRLEESYTAV